MNIITVKHRWRTGADGQPIQRTMTLDTYSKLPAIRYQQVDYPRQGFEILRDVAPRFVPKEATRPIEKPKEAARPIDEMSVGDLKEYATIKGYAGINFRQAKSGIIDQIKALENG